MEDEPCAEIIWDFTQLGVQISGRYMVRKKSDAFKQVQILNEIYGDNTHYIHIHNITYEDWVELNNET